MYKGSADLSGNAGCKGRWMEYPRLRKCTYHWMEVKDGEAGKHRYFCEEHWGVGRLRWHLH